jgi:dihydroorotate dehydrogenase
MYQSIRKLLFNFDAEKVHYFAMNALKTGNSVGFINRIIKNNLAVNDLQLQKEVFRLNFPNRWDWQQVSIKMPYTLMNSKHWVSDLLK